MYLSRNLSVMTYANGFTVWHYITTDSAAMVRSPKYFNSAAEMLRVGDQIIVNANTDNESSPENGTLFVTGNAGGQITVSPPIGF